MTWVDLSVKQKHFLKTHHTPHTEEARLDPSDLRPATSILDSGVSCVPEIICH